MQVTDLISSGSHKRQRWTTDVSGQWGAMITSFTSPLSAPTELLYVNHVLRVQYGI
jgi:hypothetical protein